MKKEINIPTTQSEITLGQYIRLQKVIDSEPDEMDLTIQMMSILCDVDNQTVRGMNKEDFDMISNQLVKTMNHKSLWKQRFFIDKVEYGFIPNLDEMTLGEYVDIDAYMKEQDFLGLMTILYRPIIHESFGRYRIKEYTGDEDLEIMNRCPLDAYNGSLFFFWNLGNELLTAIQHYLEQENSKDIQSKKTLEAGGVGINQSTQLLKETLKILKEQLN